MMENKIGQVITFNRKPLEVMPGTCKDCYFHWSFCFFSIRKLLGPCQSQYRKDQTNVCFKLINDGSEKI